MLGLLIVLVTLSLFSLRGVYLMKSHSQRAQDDDRITYSIIFPTDLRPDRTEAFLRSIGTDLRAGLLQRFKGVPTIVFETVANDSGVEHRLHVPRRHAEYLAGQLDAHVPGTTLTPISPKELDWTYGAQLHMSDPGRMLRINDAINYSTRILKAIQTDYPEETVMLQWVITGSNGTKVPASSKSARSKVSLFDALVYGISEKDDRDLDEKVREQNFAAVGRVVAMAESTERGKALVSDVVRALRSENATNKFIDKPIRRNLDEHVNNAAMSINVDVQLTVPELIPVIAWPIGDPQIPGLRQGSARRFPAVETIPRSGGRLIGYSNIPGRERPIAMSHDDAVLHTFIGGKTGRGKSVQMANQAYADMKAGKGVIVIDASASRSNETLFNRVLNYVPPERVDDVVVMDVAGDPSNPIGFNLLDQDSGRGVIDQIVGVFQSVYPGVASAVAVRDLLYHGVWTLIEHGGLTFIDLATLISPRSEGEKRWAREVKNSVNEPALKEFWERVDDGKGNVSERYAEPLHNKLWQLSGRPEVKAIIGQTQSTVKITDVLSENKIFLVNLAGLPGETAELLASLITGTIWSTAQGMKPETSNFMYLDEFQTSAKVQNGLDDMLARARKHGLGVTLATQYLETIDPKLRSAIINNTGTRIIYETSAAEARTWIPEFGGSQKVRDTDFTGIRQHEAIAIVAVDSSSSPPVTLKALAPLPPTGVAREAIRRSREAYGRNIHDVQTEIVERRNIAPKRDDKPKPFGRSPYEPKEQ